MKILLTGANGQLGTDIRKQALGIEIKPLSHAELDVTDIGAVIKACKAFKPDVIINTAANTHVDDCEKDIDSAYLVNAIGARNMAIAAGETGAKLAHISTDYVFGGGKNQGQRPLPESTHPAPINVYGASKLTGENNVRHQCHRYFIIRSSGLFGTAGSTEKKGNFVETILQLARSKGELRVVDDQIFSPTYTYDLAAGILRLIKTDEYGVFHITNHGCCSWYEFAGKIIALSGIKVKITAITSDQYPLPARRPAYSVLDNYHLRLLGQDNMRHWQDALAAYISEKDRENG